MRLQRRPDCFGKTPRTECRKVTLLPIRSDRSAQTAPPICGDLKVEPSQVQFEVVLVAEGPSPFQFLPEGTVFLFRREPLPNYCSQILAKRKPCWGGSARAENEDSHPFKDTRVRVKAEADECFHG